MIALVQHLDGVTFAEACAILTGEPPVSREPCPDRIKPTTDDQAALTKDANARLKEALAAHDAKANEAKKKESR